jgi:lipid-binding SYLF domain-containing protein
MNKSVQNGLTVDKGVFIMKTTKFRYTLPLLALALTVAATTNLIAQKGAEIDSKANAAYATLLAGSPAATRIAKESKAVLVFPSIKKAGFMIGGQYGEGSLRSAGQTLGYYKTSAASFGLQAGGQKFGYAMFFMNDKALEYLKKSDGWEVGMGPSFVVVDKGKATSMTTTTLQDDVYVFFFDQKGLMGGLGIQGTKISQITPK